MFGDEEFGTFWKEKSRLDEQMREIKKVHLSPITQPAKIIILLLSCKKKKKVRQPQVKLVNQLLLS